MKKRLFSIILILIMLFSITGCGNNIVNDTPHKGTDNIVQQEKNSTAVNKVITDKEDKEQENHDSIQSEPSLPDKDDNKDDNNVEENKTSEKNSKKETSVDSIIDTEKPDKVKLMVSRDFGRSVMFDELVDFTPRTCVMDILKSNVDVSTSYGGSFVNSINGLKSNKTGISGSRQDWFYYVNGICCEAGAADVYPAAGDVIWWDYHDWRMGPSNSAVIGCYPEPFLHGYKGKVLPVKIRCSGEDSNLAKKLIQSLEAQGCSSVRIENLEGLASEPKVPTIVIGSWDKLKNVTYLEKLNKAYKKNGMSIHFTAEGLELLDYNGQVVETITGSAGVIAAAGAGLGDSSPLWFIAGTDQNGVEMAVNILTVSPLKIAGMYGAVISAQGIIRLPAEGQTP